LKFCRGKAGFNLKGCRGGRGLSVSAGGNHRQTKVLAEGAPPHRLGTAALLLLLLLLLHMLQPPAVMMLIFGVTADGVPFRDSGPSQQQKIRCKVMMTV